MRYERASCGPSNEPDKISPERGEETRREHGAGGKEDGGGETDADRSWRRVARLPAPVPVPAPSSSSTLLRLLLQAPYSYRGRRRVVRAQAGRSRPCE